MLVATVRTSIRQSFRGLADLLVPDACAGCEHADAVLQHHLCDRCQARIARLAAIPYCTRCGRSVHPAAQSERGCAYCRHERYWNLAALVRTTPYHSVVRRMLLDLKYGNALRNGSILARHLAQALRSAPWYPQIDRLVPVPMHWLRRMQRPLNHTRALIEALSADTGLPWTPLVARHRYAPSQTEMRSHRARLENVSGCFGPNRVQEVLRGRALRGQTVCVVDNFLSSGATLIEVARTLRRMGAARVYGAVVARSVIASDRQAGTSALLGSMARGRATPDDMNAH